MDNAVTKDVAENTASGLPEAVEINGVWCERYRRRLH